MLFHKRIENIDFPVVDNHLERVAEGRELLKEGRPLSEMRTPLVGYSDKELRQKREEFIRHVEGKNPTEKRKLLERLRKSCDEADQREEGGSSELNWEINIVTALMDGEEL